MEIKKNRAYQQVQTRLKTKPGREAERELQIKKKHEVILDM